MIRTLIKTAAKLATLSALLITTAQALPFNQISQVYFFGDSLTDSGFNDLWDLFAFPLPVGKAPTFTTYGGYTWAQYVARDIKGFTLPLYPSGSYPFPNPPDTITNNTTPLNGPGPVSATLTGINYAAAGSSTNSIGFAETWAPSLHAQVENFISAQGGGRLDPNAVYFIWSGANDFLTALTSVPPPNELQLLIVAQTAANNIANEVRTLARLGARRIVVLSLPNLGLTPFATALSQTQPSLPAQLKTISYTFNSLLNQQLGYVIASFGTKILYVDVYKLLDDVILATQAGKPYVVAGQSFQFTDYTHPACNTVVQAISCPPGTPSDYLFADSLHPTDMGHQLLALQVETLIRQWQ